MRKFIENLPMRKFVINLLVAAASWLLPRSGDGHISVSATLFFLTMISLLTTLHDRWQPVMAYRVRQPVEAAGAAPVAP